MNSRSCRRVAGYGEALSKEGDAMAKSALYVIQVTGGRGGASATARASPVPPDCCAEDCYTPAYEAMKKIHGEWKLCREAFSSPDTSSSKHGPRPRRWRTGSRACPRSPVSLGGNDALIHSPDRRRGRMAERLHQRRDPRGRDVRGRHRGSIACARPRGRCAVDEAADRAR